MEFELGSELEMEGEGDFQCSETDCTFYTTDSKTISKHWEENHQPPGAVYLCPMCQCIQTNEFTFRWHLALHYRECLHFPCKSCDFIGVKAENLEAHRWKKHRREVRAEREALQISSMVKASSLSSKTSLSSPITAIAPEKENTAVNTGISREAEEQLSEILLEDSMDTDQQVLELENGSENCCELCAVDLSDERELDLHIISFHRFNGRHCCPKCPRTYGTFTDLKNHYPSHARK
jgi:hypothetical protein